MRTAFLASLLLLIATMLAGPFYAQNSKTCDGYWWFSVSRHELVATVNPLFD